MRRHSLLGCLERFQRYARDTACVQRRGYRRERWTYGQVMALAAQFARELEQRGIGRGDRVMLWGANSAEWIAAFWGCALRGAVAVPMDDIASADFARRVARQVDARLLLAGRNKPDLGIPALPLDLLREALATHPAQPYPAPDLGRDDLLQIVFTSGTTAEPRGVAISHGNVLANLEPLEQEMAKYLHYERWVHPLRFLNLVPLSHVFGQFMGMFVPPLLGATVVFHDTLNPGEIIRAIRRERVSVLVAVPRLLESLRTRLEADLDPAWLRGQLRRAEGERFWWRWWSFRRVHVRFGWKFWALISGGAALDRATEEFWTRLGFAVIQGYGLTETTSLITVNHPFKLARGAIGQALPGRDIKLDETGEILVRGENVAAGYFEGRQLTPVAGDEGWFRTGDLGALDERGNLYFRGRKKNVIVTAEGMNLYPEDLEAALRAQPGVRDAAVVALAREGNAEPCAVLLLEDGATPEAVLEAANRSLADYQRMRCWHLWPERDFPRTSTHKPRVADIQKAVAQQMGTQSATTTSTGTLSDLIARISGRSTQGGALNLSSIERVELMAAIEDRYQVELDEARFAETRTVGDLERLLHERRGERRRYPFARWAQRWPVTWLRVASWYLLSWPAVLLMAAPRVLGREDLRDLRGPALVVSNHVHEYDTAFVLAALPARLRHRLATGMHGERLYAMRYPPRELNWLARRLEQLKYLLVVALFNVFPLPKTSGYRESFAFAADLVDRGYSVLIFPEGEVTKDGRLQPFRAGIGILAADLRVPVVPVRIDGLYEVRRRRQWFSRPGTVTVRFGPPARFPADTDPEHIARQLREIVQGL